MQRQPPKRRPSVVGNVDEDGDEGDDDDDDDADDATGGRGGRNKWLRWWCWCLRVNVLAQQPAKRRETACM
jgi:hypothetical protein